jgi:hypothetical protein
LMGVVMQYKVKNLMYRFRPIIVDYDLPNYSIILENTYKDGVLMNQYAWSIILREHQVRNTNFVPLYSDFPPMSSSEELVD